MTTHKSLAALFNAIADAIRAKTGSSAQIVADDFPDEIAAISGGGASGVVYITDELDENGGIVRNITTDGATITDTTDAHGGIVRSITGAEVRLQVKTVTPSSTQQVITADPGYGALGKVIVEAGAGSMMIVELGFISNILTADHTFAEIFEAVNAGTPVFLHLEAAGVDDLEDAYFAGTSMMPVIYAFKYDTNYRVVASHPATGHVTGDSTDYLFVPGAFVMEAVTANSNPTFVKIVIPADNYVGDDPGWGW